MSRLVIGLLLTLGLAACGQSGDLYLPDDKPAASAQAPATDTAPDDNKKKPAAAPATAPQP